MMRLPPDNPELCDRLAAEYVLGTLTGQARQRFRRWLREDPSLRSRVTAWQNRLNPLVLSLQGQPPPERVWTEVSRRLGFAPGKERSSLWSSLFFWRSVAAVTTAASLLLGVAVALRLTDALRVPVPVNWVETVGPAWVAVLTNVTTNKPAFVAVAAVGSRDLILRPLAVAGIDADKALELWALPPQAAPRSLGLVQSMRATVLKLKETAAQTLADVPALAVSLEPRGGSPTGAPTGPVLYSGSLIEM